MQSKIYISQCHVKRYCKFGLHGQAHFGVLHFSHQEVHVALHLRYRSNSEYVGENDLPSPRGHGEPSEEKEIVAFTKG